MAENTYAFPFGALLIPCPPHAPKSAELFVLGAYPSALHVRWDPPKPFKLVRALAVDNEPIPFWNGKDQDARITEWRERVGWRSEWGEISSAGKLNGSSGEWVEEQIISKFDKTLDNTWITDCLDTYFLSDGVARRLADTYEPIRKEQGLPEWILPPHPGENHVVAYAVSFHTNRILSEIEQASPGIIVTLGNAALCVLKQILEIDTPIKKLVATKEDYGKSIDVRLTQKIC